jgi:hypothetical protein
MVRSDTAAGALGVYMWSSGPDQWQHTAIPPSSHIAGNVWYSSHIGMGILSGAAVAVTVAAAIRIFFLLRQRKLALRQRKLARAGFVRALALGTEMFSRIDFAFNIRVNAPLAAGPVPPVVKTIHEASADLDHVLNLLGPPPDSRSDQLSSKPQPFAPVGTP